MDNYTTLVEFPDRINLGNLKYKYTGSTKYSPNRSASRTYPPGLQCRCKRGVGGNTAPEENIAEGWGAGSNNRIPQRHHAH